MSLSLEIASKMIAASIHKAQEQGIRVSTAIVDDAGHLVAFSRMDGASWVTIKISQGKACAASGFRTSTAILTERSRSEPVWTNMVSFFEGKLMLGGGGMPVKVGGHFAGAVGVSGGKGEQDIECAKAAAEAALT